MEKDNSPEKNYEYPPEFDGEQRARTVLHEISTLLGNVRFIEDTQIPVSILSEKDKALFKVEEGQEFIKVQQYERLDHSIWQHSTGEGAGNYGITLVEHERYAREDEVEPIHLSLELMTSNGSLIINSVIPSRHFSDIYWPRSKEEMSPPRLVVESWQARPGTKLKDLLNLFLKETPSSESEKFNYLSGILSNSDAEDRAEFSPENTIHIARFIEKFWHGEIKEESAN